jgi:hypothetical protein
MPMVYSVQTMRLSCVEINSISKWTEMGFDLTHVGCTQNDFRAYGTFSANCAPILR